MQAVAEAVVVRVARDDCAACLRRLAACRDDDDDAAIDLYYHSDTSG